MRLLIRNFQSIDELDIEAPGLIMLCGPTDTGKTAIHRAIRFLLEGGRVSVDRLIRYGQSEMEVHLWHNGNHIGIRRTNTGENTFYLNEKKVTKCGNDRPGLPSVGFRPIEANRQELFPQIASQHGSLFLVGEDSDSTTRAEALAAIAAEQTKAVIDASRSAASLEKQAKSQAELVQQEKKRVDKQLDALSQWDDLELKEQAILKKHTDLLKLSDRLERLQSLSRTLKQLNSKLRAKTPRQLVSVDRETLRKLVHIEALRDRWCSFGDLSSVKIPKKLGSLEVKSLQNLERLRHSLVRLTFRRQKVLDKTKVEVATRPELKLLALWLTGETQIAALRKDLLSSQENESVVAKEKQVFWEQAGACPLCEREFPHVKCNGELETLPQGK